jgi:histone-lysine N-methyltransferase MLL2
LSSQNLNGVMVAVAELLSMKIPNSYEVLFPESPARAGIEPKKGEAEEPGEWGRKVPWDQRGNAPVGDSHLFLPVGGKEKGLSGKNPDAGPDWLKQFDAVLPGYTLKSQLDILSLLKQVGLGEEKGSVGGGEKGAA